MQSKVGDLYCQRMIIDEFALQYVKEGADGNILNKVYLDFCSAVDYLQSLDREKLQQGDRQLAKAYLREFNLDYLQNCMYMYPDEDQQTVDELAS